MCYKCPICGGNVDISTSSNTSALYYYRCENGCGFFAPDLEFNGETEELSYDNYSYNRKKLKSYLFYHKSDLRPILLSQEDFSKIDTSDFVKVYNLTPEMVENWYPKTFTEKINYALLHLSKQSKFIGDSVKITIGMFSLIFFLKNELLTEKWLEELKFTLKYLYNQELIENQFTTEQLNTYVTNLGIKHIGALTLSAKAWGIIYDLQKAQSNNKNVFVAMKFGEETQGLREKIKEGLAGYNVRIMDEIEHNNQIVPEMLYEIKNCRFVVAELSHHNNGAYYEAGYALGLGKEVIHICSEQELKSGLHFDVAQVNTITYKDINEIPEKLKKRIQATIENK